MYLFIVGILAQTRARHTANTANDGLIEFVIAQVNAQNALFVVFDFNRLLDKAILFKNSGNFTLDV